MLPEKVGRERDQVVEFRFLVLFLLFCFFFLALWEAHLRSSDAAKSQEVSFGGFFHIFPFTFIGFFGKIWKIPGISSFLGFIGAFLGYPFFFFSGRFFLLMCSCFDLGGF